MPIYYNINTNVYIKFSAHNSFWNNLHQVQMKLAYHVHIKAQPFQIIWFYPFILSFICIYKCITGADPGFQVRGGEFKIIEVSGTRHEKFLGIGVKKSRFYAKKSYFSNFRGALAGSTPLPWIRPCITCLFYVQHSILYY